MNAMVGTMALQLCMHVLTVLLLPPLLLGIINKTKAWFAGRQGPPVTQPYRDLIKLVQKESVFSTTTTWIFRFGPVVGLSTSIVAAMIIPLGDDSSPLSFTGDLMLFAYVLGLGRFFGMTAALDTGSAFEGMGAAREATYAALAEPALFFGLLVLAKITGGLRMVDMLGGLLLQEWSIAGASLLLVLASWAIVLLVENSRIPFDDPNTHLELTMIHEVMVLDHSGPAFGMIMYGAAIKLFVFAAMIVRLIVPIRTGNEAADWLLFLVSVLAVAVVVGVIESTMARLRLIAIPKLLISACVLSALGLVLVVSFPQ
jgi:formate hydrogenlyase subunit 4